MNSRTIAVVAAVLVLGGLGIAQAREGEGDVRESTSTLTEADTPDDLSINYGNRARVRLIRPDGVYSLRGKYWVRDSLGESDVDQEMWDD